MRMTIVASTLALAMVVGCGGSGSEGEAAEGAAESAGGEGADVDVSEMAFESAGDPNVDLSSLKHYAWLGAAGALMDEDGRWHRPDFDVGAEVKFLIDRELRAKDMSESSEAPSVLIAFLIAVDIESQMKELGVSSGGGEGGGADALSVPTVGRGGLVILMIDPTAQQLVWVGAATAEVQNREDAQAKARLDHAVTELLGRM